MKILYLFPFKSSISPYNILRHIYFPVMVVTYSVSKTSRTSDYFQRCWLFHQLESTPTTKYGQLIKKMTMPNSIIGYTEYLLRADYLYAPDGLSTRLNTYSIQTTSLRQISIQDWLSTHICLVGHTNILYQAPLAWSSSFTRIGSMLSHPLEVNNIQVANKGNF